MNLRVSTILLLMFAAPLLAAGDPQKAQIDAAVADAVARMRSDIEAQRLGMDLNVRDFVLQTQSSDQFVQTLRDADQIGGPRWIDNETCQVKLAIGSNRVRDTLVKIATQSGRKSPLPPDAVSAKLRVWDGRTFMATGTSISAARAAMLRPGEISGPWGQVSDEARKQTIAAARNNAIDRVIESVGSVEVSDGTKLSQVLADKTVRDRMHGWLAARPVTRLEFRNDLSVQITLCASGRAVYDALGEVMAGSDAMPKDSLKLAKLREEIDAAIVPAIGVARVSGQAKPNAALAARIPRQQPAWIAQPLNTEATAKYKGSRLKTARDAENTARDLLRERINALPISNTTMGEATKANPALERAVQQAMDRAHAYKIDYLPDGSTTVKVSLDPRDLWDQLRELP